MNYKNYLSNDNPLVSIEVEGYGVMKLELFKDVAYNTVSNMVNLIEKKYYDGLTFHRVIKNFMIQGGWGSETGCKIKGEFKQNGIDNPLIHSRGVVSMARTMDPNSATGQFFICHKDAPHIDGAYAAFGVLTEGFDVLDNIAAVKTDRADAPVDKVVITSMRVDTKGKTYDKVVCV